MRLVIAGSNKGERERNKLKTKEWKITYVDSNYAAFLRIHTVGRPGDAQEWTMKNPVTLCCRCPRHLSLSSSVGYKTKCYIVEGNLQLSVLREMTRWSPALVHVFTLGVEATRDVYFMYFVSVFLWIIIIYVNAWRWRKVYVISKKRIKGKNSCLWMSVPPDVLEIKVVVFSLIEILIYMLIK